MLKLIQTNKAAIAAAIFMGVGLYSESVFCYVVGAIFFLMWTSD